MTYEATPGHNSEALTVFRGPYINLSFQEGPVKESGENGTTNEEILRLLIERIESLDKLMHSPYNAIALEYLASALTALERRIQDRQERGVEGTNQP